MDRFVAMVILLGLLVGTVLIVGSCLFYAPITSICTMTLFYSMYHFMASDESGHFFGQEFENRFWTALAFFFCLAFFYASDSPLSFGVEFPYLAAFACVSIAYAVHVWDRHLHRVNISRKTLLRSSSTCHAGPRFPSAASLSLLRDLGIPVEDQLQRINECLNKIDQTLIPSTINNFINQQNVLKYEREIINIFQDCDARALNYLINHVKLGLIFYKIKDHRHFNGKHRTEFIKLLTVDRLSILTVVSRVIVLHSLQLLKLRANPQAETWVRNIILETFQDDLSELKTLMDSKGDYFCMPKLVFDDIKSETIRQDILRHIRIEATVQQTNRRGNKRPRNAERMEWRKVLSDVDDTLYCSGGMYPAGVDKRYSRKTVYPGVLAFYRELDLGVSGPEEWPDDRIGNLVFLSARPHLYRDMSEKANYAKFEKLRALSVDGRKGMHTMPSLLAGDLSSGSEYIVRNDFEPLARKKFDNFRRFVSIYPEYQHVFVADNGQGDVRAGELMFDGFPYEFGGLYVHVVTDIQKTYGYSPERWKQKEFTPFFFRTYPEAALHAARRKDPMISIQGLRRVCIDATKDFVQIKQFPSDMAKKDRRSELNQAIWQVNRFLEEMGEDLVELILSERQWKDGEKIRTPYGIGTVCGFDAKFDMYDVILDWRPLNEQIAEHLGNVKEGARLAPPKHLKSNLATVLEATESDEEYPRSVKANADDSSDAKQSGGESTQETKPSKPRTARQSRLRSSLPGRSGHRGVTARISGKCIKKFTPPTFPREDKHSSASLFTFFSPSTETKKTSTMGDEFTTPFGACRVLAHRSDGIVEVEMIGWKAKAYLRKELLKPVPKSLLSSFLEGVQRIGSIEPKADYPYPVGTEIITPYGKGTICKALPAPKKSVAKSISSKAMVTISLQTWKLANGRSPTLYATVENVQAWKERAAGDASSIFSALGTLVTSSKTLLTPFLAQKPALKIRKYERFFKDGAAVSTRFGRGRVMTFRETDGFYEVSLESWKLATGRTARAFLRKDDMACRVAPDCREGYPVLTSLGVSGILASVEPTTGVHIVTIPSAGMVAYLQPGAIIKPLKAAIGEEVATPYGEGRVQSYDAKRDVYVVKLSGWGALLYTKGGESFERLGEKVPDKDGQFGVNWLLGFLFFTGQQTTGTRSRSNSLSSARSRSSSVVSVSRD